MSNYLYRLKFSRVMFTIGGISNDMASYLAFIYCTHYFCTCVPVWPLYMAHTASLYITVRFIICKRRFIISIWQESGELELFNRSISNRLNNISTWSRWVIVRKSNSIANARNLSLSCINSSKWATYTNCVSTASLGVVECILQQIDYHKKHDDVIKWKHFPR